MSETKRLLRDVWDWLPVFRVVAETEHLPTAADRLHVTRAAISRTIGLLEDRLDRQLFNRSGRSLVLNDSGRALLEKLRSGMNEVESGLREATESPMSGPVRISSLGVLTNYFVLPAALSLTEEFEDLKPQLRNLRPRQAADALLRSDIEVAFFYESMTFEGLDIERVGETTNSVYCGRGHPLFEADDVDVDELREHPFSVPGIGDTGKVMDDWPTDLSRQIGMQIELLTSNLEVCRSGQFLTVLPDVTALEWVERGEIRRFDFDLIPPTPLYAAKREGEDPGGRADAVVEAVERRAEEVAEEVEEMRSGRVG